MTQSLITVAQARERVLHAAKRLEQERLPVDEALDRVLAEHVSAAGDVPPFACSAMDGYAIQAGPAGRILSVVGESRAGRPATDEVRTGEAIRISTGAALPAGATAILKQEDATGRGRGRVEALVHTAAGANIRGAGEDMKRGTSVLRAGTALGAAELGAAVAAGAGALTVTRQPRVAVLCTGDELRAPGERLAPGQIHNSNASMLVALSRHSGAIAEDALRIPDDREATEAGLTAALDRADLVIVSGGVSVGPHDHVKPVLASLSVEEQFWGVSLQPGKPTWFGAKDGTLVFGLPGNPVSAVVTFVLFVAPAIASMLGSVGQRPLDEHASLGEAVRRNPRRTQAVRVRLERRGDETVAILNGPQGSHIVSSLLGADALALIPPGDSELAAGTRVELEPLPR
jgi:molybdopterin molybdotransferase